MVVGVIGAGAGVAVFFWNLFLLACRSLASMSSLFFSVGVVGDIVGVGVCGEVALVHVGVVIVVSVELENVDVEMVVLVIVDGVVIVFVSGDGGGVSVHCGVGGEGCVGEAAVAGGGFTGDVVVDFLGSKKLCRCSS